MAAVVPFFGELSPYWIGVLGSLSVEIATATNDCGKAHGVLPPRYKSFPYLVVRTLLAFMGGGMLPVVLEAANGMTSFWLGASAPIVLDKLERGVHPAKLGGGDQDKPN